MRARLVVAGGLFILMALTVPWFFIGSEPAEGGGLPRWVVYALAMNVVFPIAVAAALSRAWGLFEGGED